MIAAPLAYGRGAAASWQVVPQCPTAPCAHAGEYEVRLRELESERQAVEEDRQQVCAVGLLSQPFATANCHPGAAGAQTHK